MIKRQTLIILAVLCMMSLFVTTASANDVEDATIGIGNGSGYVTIPITVTNATNAGSADVTLRYDPSIVMVVDVVKGDMSITALNLENTADGWIRIGAFQVGDGISDTFGLSGTFVLANVSFEPVGTTGSCPLEISVTTFGDATSNSTEMPYIVSNGIYTLISEESKDDDNGDDDRYAWYLYEDRGSGKNVTEENPSVNETVVETPTAPPLKKLPGIDTDDEDDGGISWMWLLIVLALVAVVVGAYLLSRKNKDENGDGDMAGCEGE